MTPKMVFVFFFTEFSNPVNVIEFCNIIFIFELYFALIETCLKWKHRRLTEFNWVSVVIIIVVIKKKQTIINGNVQKIIYTNKSPGEVEANLRFGKSLLGKRPRRFADVFIYYAILCKSTQEERGRTPHEM